MAYPFGKEIVNEKYYRIRDEITSTGKYRSEFTYLKLEGTSDISDLVIDIKRKGFEEKKVDCFECEEEYLEYLTKSNQ